MRLSPAYTLSRSVGIEHACPWYVHLDAQVLLWSGGLSQWQERLEP